MVITEVMGFDEADADAVRESRPYVNDLMWVHEGRGGLGLQAPDGAYLLTQAQRAVRNAYDDARARFGEETAGRISAAWHGQGVEVRR